MIDATELMTVVDTVVEKRGEDWTYPNWKDVITRVSEEEYDGLWLPQGCHYFWQEDDVEAGKILGLDLVKGQPACLVGAVLSELNLNDMITEEENGNAVCSLDGLEGTFDEDARAVLSVGQSCQDAGDPWGKVREKMHERLTADPDAFV
jgi:hypothetical protein